ncbi:RDD family protein [Micromonospora sp. WMMD558]|uniref:RDD family protein n=1 Tax=unclassified Micromonospora TaxID=2617518 RepID=UPI001E40CF0E|nr:RDD family protein [Micromonospora sp. WMMC415]
MTQPPSYPMPPAGGPPPAAGGSLPPAGPPGYAVPPQWAPVAPPGWPAPPGYAGPPGPVPPPPALAPNGLPLASFPDRLVAWLVDAALATVVALVFFLPVYLVLWLRMFREMTRTNPDGTPVEPDPRVLFQDFLLPLLLAYVGLFVLVIALYWLYHVEYLLRRDGQTFGKKIMKLRVVPLDPARPLTRRTVGRRWLVQYLAGTLVPGLSYVDGFWQLWDKPWQQCLHDKFAETVVVKVAE